MSGLSKRALNRVLGRRLRQARKAAGLTQAEASRLLGCGQPWISKAERGERAITAVEQLDFARAYETTVMELGGSYPTDEELAWLRQRDEDVALGQPIRWAVRH